MRYYIFNLTAVMLAMPLFVFAAVNINTASVGTLQTLTGIGEVKAQAIVDYREQNGPFNTREEIMNVSGIGQGTYDTIKNDITVGSAQENEEEEPEDNDVADDATTESSSSSGGSSEPEPPVADLLLNIPKYGFVGQPIAFDVEPASGTKGRLVRYTWNFGDGSVAESKDPTHVYQFPGSYVVTVMSYYQNKEVMEKTTITIAPSELSLERTGDGDIRLHNQSEFEMNISGMRLVGRGTFVFPKHSHILPDSTVIITKEKIDARLSDTVALVNSLDTVVASIKSPSLALNTTAPPPETQSFVYQAPAPRTLGAAVAEAAEQPAQAESMPEVSVPQAIAAESEVPASQRGSENPRWPYLGLVGVLLVGFLAFYGAKQ